MNRHDSKAQLEAIWEALHTYREHSTLDDGIWDDLCTAMAWIEEDLIDE
jgi:hypothetical protein